MVSNKNPRSFFPAESLALSTQSIVAFALLTGTIATVTDAQSLTGTDWVLVLAIQLLASATLVALGKSSRFARESKYLVAVLLIVGATRGLMLSFAIPSESLASRVLISMVMTLVWSVALGLVIRANREFRVEFDSVVSASIRSALQGAQSAQNTQNLQSNPWTQAEAVSRTERERALSQLDLLVKPPGEQSASVDGQVLEVAREIHRAIDERIRPLSHQMWAEQRPQVPRRPLGYLVRSALGTWPIPVAFSAALIAAIELLGVAPRIGAGPAVVITLVLTLVTTGLSVVRNSLPVTALGRFLRASALVSTLPIGFVVIELTGRGLDLPTNQLGSWVMATAAFSVILAVTITAGIVRSRAEFLAALTTYVECGAWANYGLQVARTQQTSDAATFLHHRVQSELLAIALQLELAVDSGDPHVIAQTTELMRQRLAMRANEPSVPTPSRKHIFEIAADWRGICEVRLDLPAEGDLNPDSWGELDLLCREFVANAVRSGKASIVTICVISAPTQIQVDIMDNGSGFAPGPAGLGTTWLTQLSGGSWSLIPSESGAHISITLSKG